MIKRKFSTVDTHNYVKKEPTTITDGIKKIIFISGVYVDCS